METWWHRHQPSAQHLQGAPTAPGIARGEVLTLLLLLLLLQAQIRLVCKCCPREELARL